MLQEEAISARALAKAHAEAKEAAEREAAQVKLALQSRDAPTLARELQGRLEALREDVEEARADRAQVQPACMISTRPAYVNVFRGAWSQRLSGLFWVGVLGLGRWLKRWGVWQAEAEAAELRVKLQQAQPRAVSPSVVSAGAGAATERELAELRAKVKAGEEERARLMQVGRRARASVDFSWHLASMCVWC